MKIPIIKDFRLKSELGQGGMATVYLAHDNKFETNVAIKVLNKEFVQNENIRKRFIAEARKMFKMSHPNIIKVTDLIEEGDTVAFVMEYIEGETLKEYIDRKGKLNDDEIKNLFTQMLDAVGYVHKQKLVHRDIKPSNFMINHEGQIKLMDFGIAKTTDTSSAEYTQTGTGVQMGTPMYMSPEQITETKSVTTQSDIYSLGVVLWQMVTNQKPYDTKTLSNFQLQTKIVNENLPNTSSIFDNIIQKATQKHTEQRFQNIQDFKDALKHPTKNTDLEQTIINLKMVEEETVVIPKVRSEVKDQKEVSPKKKTEQKAAIEKPPREKKKRGIALFIPLGIAAVALLIFLFWLKTQSEEQPITTLTLFEQNNLYGYKLGDNIVITPSFTTAEAFENGQAKVSRNDSIFTINEQGIFVALLNEAQLKVKAEAERQKQENERKAQIERERLAEAERQKQENERKAQAERQRKAQEQVNSQPEYKTFKAGIRAIKIPGKSYYMGETEVTRAQFEAFVNATGYQTTAEKEGNSWVFTGDLSGMQKKDGVNWRHNINGSGQQPTNHPVIRISWHDAVAFAQWVGGKLPTESEWEHAAKGGQNYTYAGSNNINEVAWYRDNSGNKTHPVKSKKPNGYGLYDMSGNVSEWTATTDGSYRFLKGGTWNTDAEFCRITFSSFGKPSENGSHNGFRVLFP